MPEIYVIAHDMRSTFNVGSLFRTAEGLGVAKLFLTGYTPYPALESDKRLPHISQKLDKQITKTALGAEQTLVWEYREDIHEVLAELAEQNIQVVALEQTDSSVPLPEFKPDRDVALLLGTEVTGLPDDILSLVQNHIEIPMFGSKESFNVIQAAAMALYHLRFR